MEGYYDGVIFHRIVKGVSGVCVGIRAGVVCSTSACTAGFIIQTGDPTGTGTGENLNALVEYT